MEIETANSAEPIPIHTFILLYLTHKKMYIKDDQRKA